MVKFMPIRLKVYKKGREGDTEFLREKLNAEGPTNFLQDLGGEFLCYYIR